MQMDHPEQSVPLVGHVVVIRPTDALLVGPTPMHMKVHLAVFADYMLPTILYPPSLLSSVYVVTIHTTIVYEGNIVDYLENMPNLHTIIYTPRAYSPHVPDRIIQKDTTRAHKALAASKFSLYVHGSSVHTCDFLRKLYAATVYVSSLEKVNVSSKYVSMDTLQLFLAPAINLKVLALRIAGTSI